MRFILINKLQESIATRNKIYQHLTSSKMYEIFRSHRRLLPMIAATVLVGTACSSSDSPSSGSGTSPSANASIGEIRSVDCFPTVANFDGVSCSVLTVPANDPADSNKTYDIAYATLPATEGPTTTNPIVILAGGPGASAILESEGIVKGPLSALRAKHDLILFDQRATGHSEPDLSCPNIKDIAACRSFVASRGINPATVNTALIAADIELLRTSLGYQQLNLWGGSYGTRLALTIMRDFPASVEAVVLDSVFPLEVNGHADDITSSLSTLDAALISCEKSLICNKKYPELRSKVKARLAETDGTDIAQRLIELFEDPSSPMGVMDQMAAITSEDPQTNSSIPDTDQPESPQEDEEDGQSMQMSWSVTCQEEDPAAQTSIIPTGWPDHLIQEASNPENWADATEICEKWNVPLAPPIESEPVVSDIPALVIIGTFDLSTPPIWSNLAAKNLSNSTTIVFDAVGHLPSMENECAAQAAANFLSAPSKPVDLSCIPKDPFS